MMLPSVSDPGDIQTHFILATLLAAIEKLERPFFLLSAEEPVQANTAALLSEPSRTGGKTSFVTAWKVQVPVQKNFK